MPNDDDTAGESVECHGGSTSRTDLGHQPIRNIEVMCTIYVPYIVEFRTQASAYSLILSMLGVCLQIKIVNNLSWDEE